MLYQRWRQVAAARSDDWALREEASGRRWTFGQLAAEAERRTAPEGTAFPRGHSAEFVLTLLAAWREGRVVCPLEPDQPPPETPAPPPGCRHVKGTSATTGAARFVAFTPEQLAADADNIVATMGLRADWPNLGAISLAHSYGFSNLVLPLLLHGVPLILAPSPLPEALRHAAEGEKCLTLAAAPAMWSAWRDTGAIPAGVRLAISAGAALPLKLERDIFEAHGLKIHNFYGATECGGIAYDASESPRTDATLTGAPLRNVEASLHDDGCLRVRGAAVGETYWPEASDALRGGTFVTSDLAELRDGAVYLRGRVGDQINVAGRKLSPETVERALLAHPRVRECVVFGTPSGHAERGDLVVAVVASSATEAELRDFLLTTLPAWQTPREWRFVESLSASARGKISRSEWRRRFEGGMAA